MSAQLKLAVLSTATAVTLGLATSPAGAVATTSPNGAVGNPYVAGDMHNHNTCTDGSVDAGYTVDRAVGTGTAAAGGTNFGLDWFTLGNHGGSGNRDCRFADPSAKLPDSETYGPNNPPPTPPATGRATLWTDTLGLTIDGITITSLKGTPNGNNMWRWQNIEEVEYPILSTKLPEYNKVLIEGLEWITPGHEHTDVAIISGQFPRRGTASADNVAQFEFRYDRADNDAIGQLDASGNQLWTGKDNVNNNGTAGHGKAVNGVAWLQANFPLTSYAVPTHTERQGPFDPANSKGWNIEHFRDFNNAGPTVAFGIESPGHMAQGTINGGSGSYGSGAVGGGTYGLQGVYTAKVGGLWDGLLGEGRNSFIYVSSDWHQRGIFGARDATTTSDFMPGEMTKLYVQNQGNFRAQNIIDGMRSGNSYAVNGNLIGPDLSFKAFTLGQGGKGMGQTLVVNPGDKVYVRIELTVPGTNNSPYSFANPLLAQDGISQPLNAPQLDHVDLITGDITGVIAPGATGYAVPNAAGTAGAAIVYNPSTKIAQQLLASNAKVTVNTDGSKKLSWTTSLTAPANPFYIRIRGTNIPDATPNVTDSSGNPLLDLNNAKVACTDPACPTYLDTVSGVKQVTYDVQAYSNLWFYANPIFVRPAGTPKLLVETNADLASALLHGTGK